MKIELRDYQKEAVETVMEKFTEGKRRLLMQMPTGTGKTIVFSEIIKRIDRPTLLLAHRDELINQAQDKLLMVYPEGDIGVVKAERNETAHQITVASVQTLARQNRLAQIRDDIGFIITDECHHAAARSYKRIYHRFGVYTEQDAKKQKDFTLDVVGHDVGHLGVTATPERNDRFGLLPVFDEICYHKPFIDFVPEYLCDLGIKGIETSLNLTGVKSTSLSGYGYEYQSKSLSEVVNTAEVTKDILRAYQKYASDRKRTLAFCVDRAHAKRLYDQFLSSGIPGGYLDGETPAAERKQTLADFEDGLIKVLFNIMVLTEGYDCPPIDCILLARPTRSPSLLTQIIGRGTRNAEGKENCLILDVAHAERATGNLVDIASLFYPIEALEEDRPVGEMSALGGCGRDSQKTPPDVSGKQVYSVESIRELLEEYHASRRSKKSRGKPWENHPATDKQKNYVKSLFQERGLLTLEKQIVDINAISKGEASQIIDSLGNAPPPVGENACPKCNAYKQAKFDLCYDCHQVEIEASYSDICPECDQPKPQEYDLCYSCWRDSQIF